MQALKIEDIVDNIDFMPVNVKTMLVEKLLGSIHQPQSEIDRAWLGECESRVQNMGALEDGKEVFDSLRKSLHK